MMPQSPPERTTEVIEGIEHLAIVHREAELKLCPTYREAYREAELKLCPTYEPPT